jgi:hypothetical protein
MKTFCGFIFSPRENGGKLNEALGHLATLPYHDDFLNRVTRWVDFFNFCNFILDYASDSKKIGAAVFAEKVMHYIFDNMLLGGWSQLSNFSVQRYFAGLQVAECQNVDRQNVDRLM